MCLTQFLESQLRFLDETEYGGFKKKKTSKMKFVKLKLGSKWKRVRESFGFATTSATAGGSDNVGDQNPQSQPPPPPPPPPPTGDRTSASPTPVTDPPRTSQSTSVKSAASNKSPPPMCSICQLPVRGGSPICSICNHTMRPGQAIFIPECRHTFHFSCIAEKVEHGHRTCPTCRCNWKLLPSIFVAAPTSPDSSARHQSTLTGGPVNPLNVEIEPAIFNDDEPFDRSLPIEGFYGQRRVQIETYTQVPSVPKSSTVDDFTICLHVEDPILDSLRKKDGKTPQASRQAHAPIDLVIVIDISGSMCGTKMALLKQATGFVIENLDQDDRLSVVVFSAKARRLFPLRRMSDNGRQLSLQAVNSLVAVGGTDIADGLRKGAKVLEDRSFRNPIASIMLLSDGRDTNTINYDFSGGSENQPDYRVLLPASVIPDNTTGFKIPVHTFGLGFDHDAVAMHVISDATGGTFSFIENEEVIQDAFAQCIGGLLSVMAKDLRVRFECTGEGIRLGSIKAGSHLSRVFSNQRAGLIDVGNLYVDESRDLLVSVNVPVDETSLLKVSCEYNNPWTDEPVTVEAEEVTIERPEVAREENVSIQVDRQQNRIRAAAAMAEARTTADDRDLPRAVSILENTRKAILETVSGEAKDKFCASLNAELKEMQERMANKYKYETSGRAYILSGLSSHSWQRATGRGLGQSYETRTMSSMVNRSRSELVQRSETSLLRTPSVQSRLRPTQSGQLPPR